jgi:hypothetical protein
MSHDPGWPESYRVNSSMHLKLCTFEQTELRDFRYYLANPKMKRLPEGEEGYCDEA